MLTDRVPPAGAEPGVDPLKPDGGHASMASLRAACEITVVDFSPDRLAIQKFDNDSLVPFLRMPQPAWARRASSFARLAADGANRNRLNMVMARATK